MAKRKTENSRENSSIPLMAMCRESQSLRMPDEIGISIGQDKNCNTIDGAIRRTAVKNHSITRRRYRRDSFQSKVTTNSAKTNHLRILISILVVFLQLLRNLPPNSTANVYLKINRTGSNLSSSGFTYISRLDAFLCILNRTSMYS